MNKFLLTAITLLALFSIYSVYNSTPEASPNNHFLAAGETQATFTYTIYQTINSKETVGGVVQSTTINAVSKTRFSPVYVKSSNSYNVMVDYEDIVITKPDPELNDAKMEYNYDKKSTEIEEIVYRE